MRVVQVDAYGNDWVRLMLHVGWTLAFEPGVPCVRWEGPAGWWADVDFGNDPILYRLWAPGDDGVTVTAKSVKEFRRLFGAYEAPAVPITRDAKRG